MRGLERYLQLLAALLGVAGAWMIYKHGLPPSNTGTAFDPDVVSIAHHARLAGIGLGMVCASFALQAAAAVTGLVMVHRHRKMDDTRPPAGEASLNILKQQIDRTLTRKWDGFQISLKNLRATLTQENQLENGRRIFMELDQAKAYFHEAAAEIIPIYLNFCSGEAIDQAAHTGLLFSMFTELNDRIRDRFAGDVAKAAPFGGPYASPSTLATVDDALAQLLLEAEERIEQAKLGYWQGQPIYRYSPPSWWGFINAVLDKPVGKLALAGFSAAVGALLTWLLKGGAP